MSSTERSTRFRAKLEQEGKCARCRRACDRVWYDGTPKKTCSRCSKKIAIGKNVRKVDKILQANVAPAATMDIVAIRRSVLRDVHDAWVDARNVGQFAAWLRARIEESEDS